MTKKKFMVRQGDVLLRCISEIPVDAVVVEKKDKAGRNRIVLAYGEVTGHAHQIEDIEAVDVFVKADGTMYLAVKNETELRHEEHGTIAIPAGNYQRVLQVEYTPEAIRNVAD